MFPRHNDFEELGRKVRRAEEAVREIRGIGAADGVEVVVDAENRLVSVTAADEVSILRAYHAALADMQPALDAAMREIGADPRFLAVSTFTEANAAARAEAGPSRQHRDSDGDDHYHEERNRYGWF